MTADPRLVCRRPADVEIPDFDLINFATMWITARSELMAAFARFDECSVGWTFDPVPEELESELHRGRQAAQQRFFSTAAVASEMVPTTTNGARWLLKAAIIMLQDRETEDPRSRLVFDREPMMILQNILRALDKNMHYGLPGSEPIAGEIPAGGEAHRREGGS